MYSSILSAQFPPFSVYRRLLSTLSIINSFTSFTPSELYSLRYYSDQSYPSPSGQMTTSPDETAIFASGCFWGTEHIFRKHYDGKGLIDAKVGYTGGTMPQPTYTQVCKGSTGHAEAVKLKFDPQKVSYATLVEFFYRTHDASHLNHQGPDRGTQYRSAIFYTTAQQKRIAEEVTQAIQDQHYNYMGKKIVTEIEQFQKWWDAEDYHQMYLHHNPDGYECPTHRLHW